MGLLQRLLHITNFRNPFLRTLVPSVGFVFALQLGVAGPSIALQSDRFYDVSGSLTYLAATALSLYLPALRARAAAALAGAPKPELPSLLAALTGPGPSSAMNWRQVALSAALGMWATRLGSYLFYRILKEGKDSRFDVIKKNPRRFLLAFVAQALWVTLCSLPVLAVNSVPAAALAAAARSSAFGLRVTDMLGLGLFALGFGVEVVADSQKSRWVAEKHNKIHDEAFMTRGLWAKSQYPNYFGEITLWTGIATATAGVLRAPAAQAAIGLGGGIGGTMATTAMSAVSPAFSYFILTRLSGIPLSERKYNKLYGDRKDYQEWKANTPRLIPKIL